tara:strand:+ start:268 stop:477 length:210 start_codon:yes stop_codon:yes gene_type:complete
MLPNGGFPPIVKCEDKSKTNEIKEKDNKGFFYSTKTNTINIREILKKTSSKVVSDTRTIDDDLEVVESL